MARRPELPDAQRALAAGARGVRAVAAFGSARVRRAVVAGFGATAIGRHADRAPLDLALDALAEALAGCEMRPADLDGVVVVPEGYIRARPPLLPQRVAERLGIPCRTLVEVENGGCSALLALKAACQEIALGAADAVAVLGAQAERRFTGGEMDAGDIDRFLQLNAMYGPWLGPYGVVAALPVYALAAQRYMFEHGIEPEAIAELAVLLRRNAALNPRAELRDPLTVADVLASRVVSPPIHKLEAAPWSDAGSAVVVVSEELARSRGLGGAVLTGWGERHDDANFVPFGKDLTLYPWIGAATDDALARAGRKRDDLDVLEVYGAFAHAELMTYEAMGLFGPGEAPAAVARGATAIGGPLAINPSGGRLSLGHPPQATPLLMVGELLDQLAGRAGERQVGGAEVALVQAEHGMMNGAAVAVLESWS